MRLNLGQEFVIGGFTPGTLGLDAVIVGVYEKGKLNYVARVRAGFVPASRRAVYELLKPLVTKVCPVAFRIVWRNVSALYGVMSWHAEAQRSIPRQLVSLRWRLFG
jgi:ATP-dependent DNA ligase